MVNLKINVLKWVQGYFLQWLFSKRRQLSSLPEAILFFILCILGSKFILTIFRRLTRKVIPNILNWISPHDSFHFVLIERVLYFIEPILFFRNLRLGLKYVKTPLVASKRFV